VRSFQNFPNHQTSQKFKMKNQKFVLPFIAVVVTSVFGAPVIAAPAASSSTPGQTAHDSLPANKPIFTSTQPASPATGSQTLVTNNLSGQTFVTNNPSGQTFVTNTLTGQNINQQF
jgi:ABC-type oligopeptide transport system substrate-binding subunit